MNSLCLFRAPPAAPLCHICRNTSTGRTTCPIGRVPVLYLYLPRLVQRPRMLKIGISCKVPDRDLGIENSGQPSRAFTSVQTGSHTSKRVTQDKNKRKFSVLILCMEFGKKRELLCRYKNQRALPTAFLVPGSSNESLSVYLFICPEEMSSWFCEED